MPTYQYTCTDCGQPLEAVQRFSDPALTECPTCGGRLRKVFSSVGVVFKGSGFYRTDSRAGASSANGDSGSKDGAGSGDKAAASANGSSTASSSGSSNGSSSGSSSGSSNGSAASGSTASGGSKAASSAA